MKAVDELIEILLWQRGLHAPSFGGCRVTNELYPLAGVKQIVGHTPAWEPRWAVGKTQLCIDTALGNGPTHCAVISDGAVEVKGV